MSAGLQDLRARTLANIEVSRALLARSGKRLDREEQAAGRQQARQERQQAEIDRAAAQTEMGLAIWLPDPAQEIERSRRLRAKILTAVEGFAASEARIARCMRTWPPPTRAGARSTGAPQIKHATPPARHARSSAPPTACRTAEPPRYGRRGMSCPGHGGT